MTSLLESMQISAASSAHISFACCAWSGVSSMLDEVGHLTSDSSAAESFASGVKRTRGAYARKPRRDERQHPRQCQARVLAVARSELIGAVVGMRTPSHLLGRRRSSPLERGGRCSRNR